MILNAIVKHVEHNAHHAAHALIHFVQHHIAHHYSVPSEYVAHMSDVAWFYAKRAAIVALVLL